MSIRLVNIRACLIIWVTALSSGAVEGQIWNTVGNAAHIGDSCYTLTTGNSQKGAVWNPTQIDISLGFDMSFWVTLQNPGGGAAADGMAFVFQDMNANAIGAGGNGLGYGSSNPVSSGPITNSFAIEFDLWDNSGNAQADPTGSGTTTLPSGDHIGFHANGVLASALDTFPILPAGVAFDDGVCRLVRITYNPGTTELTVYVDGAFRANIIYDINANVFSSLGFVWFGWTASSGGVDGMFQICMKDFAVASPDLSTCVGQPINLQGSGGGSGGGIIYSWREIGFNSPAFLSSGFAQNPLYNASGAAPPFMQYEVTVTNSIGCTDVDTMDMITILLPTIDAGIDTTICAGGTAFLGVPDTAGYTYSWSSGATLDNSTIAQPLATPLVTTWYYLTAADTSGAVSCTTLDSVEVVVIPLPNALAGNDTLICISDCIQIGSLAQVGMNYTWSPSISPTMDTVAKPTVCLSAFSTYSVVVNDPVYNCYNYDTINVDVQPRPVVFAGNDTVICDTFLTIMSSITGGISPSANWVVFSGLGTVQSPTSDTSLVTGLSNGTNILIREANDLPCVSRDTIRITVIPLIVADAGPDSSICLDSIRLWGTPPPNGIGTWTILSGGGNFLMPTSALSFINGIPTDTSYYQWDVVDGPCALRDTLMLINNMTTAYAGPDTTVCGGNYVMQGEDTTIISGLWTMDTLIAFIDSVEWSKSFISSLDSGINTFYWTVTKGNCTVVDTVAINSLGRVYANAGPDTALCDTLLFIKALPIGTDDIGIWTSNPSQILTILDTLADTTLVMGLQVGMNRLAWTVSDSVCSVRDSLFIWRDTTINAYAGPDQTVSSPVTFLAANDPMPNSGIWSTILGPGIAQNWTNQASLTDSLIPGINEFMWTINNGTCPNTIDIVRITFIEDLFIPEAISPNGDFLNDAFIINGLEHFPGTKLQIFNRWGNLVYQTDDYGNDWDGKNDGGSELSDDTYYYLLDIPEQGVYKGFLVVKRN